MNSTLYSIILLTVFCQFSSTIDWDTVPHGKIMEYDLIVNVPENMILGEINGGNVLMEQYHLAMKIRSYKYLYLLVTYVDRALYIEEPTKVMGMVIRSTKKIILFMNNYGIDISDLEKYGPKFAETTNYTNDDKEKVARFLKNFKKYLYKLLFYDNEVFNKKYPSEEELKSNKKFDSYCDCFTWIEELFLNLKLNNNNEEELPEESSEESVEESDVEISETDLFRKKLKAEIDTWDYFQNLINDPKIDEYYPPTSIIYAQCVPAAEYVYEKLEEDYSIL